MVEIRLQQVVPMVLGRALDTVTVEDILEFCLEVIQLECLMVTNLPSPHSQICRAKLQTKQLQTHVVQQHHSPLCQTGLKIREHCILSILGPLQEVELTARQHQIHTQIPRAQAPIHPPQTEQALLNQRHTEDPTALQLHTTHRAQTRHLSKTRHTGRKITTVITETQTQKLLKLKSLLQARNHNPRRRREGREREGRRAVIQNLRFLVQDLAPHLLKGSLG